MFMDHYALKQLSLPCVCYNYCTIKFNIFFNMGDLVENPTIFPEIVFILHFLFSLWKVLFVDSNVLPVLYSFAETWARKYQRFNAKYSLSFARFAFIICQNACDSVTTVYKTSLHNVYRTFQSRYS